MIGCYIFFSEKLQKFYIGATQEDVDQRFVKHNENLYGNHRYTAPVDDWKLYLFIPAKDYPMAIRIERKIKSMKSSNYIKNLIKYPELLSKLVSSI